MSAPQHSPREVSTRDSVSRLASLVEIALIWAVFIWHAGWPPPDPNEPHYLGKARHFWNPDWIPADFFLDSPDAHQVFYFSVGWLTLWLPFVQVAWIGRLLTWGLIAWGWQRLSTAVVPRAGFAVLSAVLYVAGNEHLQMAGEWVVGGFEAKGIAYALVFFGLAALASGRWNATWILLGAASAFHVVVGGWSVIAAGFAWLITERSRASFLTMLPGLFLGGLLSLPGLLPVLLLSRGVDPDIVRLGNGVYFDRLPHHLELLAFKDEFILRHVLLLVAWVLLVKLSPATAGLRRLRFFVAGAVAIAACGAALSLLLQNNVDLLAAVMRFYWFRMSDAILPLGVAIEAVYLVWSLPATRPAAARFWLAVAAGLAIGHLYISTGRLWTSTPRADKPGKVANLEDWKDACRWIRQHTPPDARFLTPRSSQTFRWHAERSEVANWKDIPQDPDGLVSWRVRLQDSFYRTDPRAIHRWHESPGGLPIERLQALSERYEVDYLLCPLEATLELPTVYHNNTYAVYRLDGLRTRSEAADAAARQGGE